MNLIVTNPVRVEKARRGWISRLLIGSGLLAVSVWGIGICHESFQTSLGPAQSPADPGFVSLGAWAAWFVFFGPVAAAGLLTVWFTLRKTGAMEEMAVWLAKRAGPSGGLLASNNQFEARSPRNGIDDPHGLKSLSDEQVEQLKLKATRAAFLLGMFAGISLLGIGVVGLVFLSSLSQPYSGSAPYVPLGTGRLTINLAVLSGMSLLLGLAVLRQTFRKENKAWMLPLRVFTYTLLRRQRASQNAQSTPRPPDTKRLS